MAQQRDYFFVRDDHTSIAQHARLTADLLAHRFRGGDLYCEFAYEPDIDKLMSVGAAADEARELVLCDVLATLSLNGWTREYNRSVLDMLVAAISNDMRVHALDSPEWSRAAFEERYGRFRGGLKYLQNRASPADDGEGASSRWARKVLERHAEDESAVVVIGGAEHGPVMLQILRNRCGVRMELLYEGEDEMHETAHRKVSTLLREATRSRLLADTDDDDDESKILSIIDSLLKGVRALESA
ncbi:hypothetical protein KFE25_010327 [Diacronema lutheri]|uniref:Uncharacterized protein n=1 Tax=Diacronema lutheri TaxID=2081491 RepID=A0A8J6C5C4_DIALT|nr:hypothetical protein KFE25_010327 [Diacronema lutheri]